MYKSFGSTTASAFRNPIFWAVFVLYIIFSWYTIAHHEMWGDEIHSWNIAKGSAGFSDLIHNTRYEGHPPVWYICIWTISKFTHNLIFVQAFHWLIAAIVIFLILFFSPMPLMHKLLIPFGYYFLFEYSVLSRNYVIAVLLTFVICIIMRKNFRYKIPLYYLLLFLLSNTHLLGILIAGSLHVYFLFLYKEQNKKKTIFNLHFLIGILVVLPAVYFIFPPSDSEMNVQFWLDRWGRRNFEKFSQSPLRAFIPVSAWWLYTFWNSQFLLEEVNKYKSLWIANLATAILVVVFIIFILRKNKKSSYLFLSNLLFSFMVAMTFFTLGAARYSGFLFIGFIAAWWMYCYETPVSKVNRHFVTVLLVLQLWGSVQPVFTDIRSPFSNAYRVNELLNKVPAGERTVTDYWTLNVIAAFADKPFYCIDLEKEISFILWDSELKAVLSKPERFTTGINNLFKKENISQLNLISSLPPDILAKVDPQLEKNFIVSLVDKREGAIERSSNLYLYHISLK